MLINTAPDDCLMYIGFDLLYIYIHTEDIQKTEEELLQNWL